MSGIESAVVSFALNSLWQVPLIFAAAWIAARMLRSAGSDAEHRVWVGALLLQSLLPAISILKWQRIHASWPWHAAVAAIADGQIAVQMGAGTAKTSLQLPDGVMVVLATAYALMTAYFVARLTWQCARLFLLMRGTKPQPLSGEVALACAQWSRRFGLKRTVAIVCSKEIFAPVTVGVVRNRIVLPAGMASRLADTDFDTALAHEFAHIARKDFLKNLVYEVMSLPVSYHPCLWVSRQRIMETREMVCDAMAAEVSGRQVYAQSLLRLASLLLQGKPVRVPHAVGIFDANTLERRLMKLTEKKKEMGRLRMFVSIGACVVLGIATATSAVGLGFGARQETSAESDSSKGIPTSIPPEKMQERVISKVPPVYPPDAKIARIQGTVVLKAVIGKEGHVENLQVVSGPSKLQQSALDAARQWVYKPYLVNGNPVEVETKINVVYSLKK